VREAVALLDSAAAASPQDPDIYLLRARATLALGELRRSWSDAELAARLGRPWQGAALAVLADARVRGPGGARAAAGALLERATAPGAALTADEAAHVALALEGVGRATDAAAMAARVPGAAAALERLRGERPASPAP
jgi:hypothetical protein